MPRKISLPSTVACKSRISNTVNFLRECERLDKLTREEMIAFQDHFYGLLQISPRLLSRLAERDRARQFRHRSLHKVSRLLVNDGQSHFHRGYGLLTRHCSQASCRAGVAPRRRTPSAVL